MPATATTATSNPVGVKGTFLSIASSPTGGQVYLAGPDASSIAVFDGTSLVYESSINLVYSGSGLTSFATLDIRQWLENNGLYNQSIPWFSQYASSSVYTDMLDQPIYHHVLGISDVDGYLYVLDDWAATPNEGSQSAQVGQISFNLLLLRVMNSTGAEQPLGGSTVPDLAVLQQCVPAANSGFIGDPKSSSPQCLTSSQVTASDCPTVQGAAGGNSCTPQPVSSTGCIGQTGSEYGCFSIPNGSGVRLFGLGGSGVNTYSTLVQSGSAGQTVYPPYGWILSANVTAVGTPGSGGSAYGSASQIVSFCSTSTCTYSHWKPKELLRKLLPDWSLRHMHIH